MPHVPQTAVVRLIQALTDARDITPGMRVAVRPHRVVLGPEDGLAALKAFRLGGGDKVRDPDSVLLYADSLLPQPDEASARKLKQLLEAADKEGLNAPLPHAGGEVADVLDNLHVVPGECAVSPLPEVMGLGAIGALGLRATPHDVAELLHGNALKLTVPHTVRVNLTGARQEWASGRDVFWALLREVGYERLAGNVLELAGDGLPEMPLNERVKLAALACHAGVFACYCLPDRATVQELNRHAPRPYQTFEPERDAAAAHTATLDLQHAVPAVVPPGNERPAPVGEFTGKDFRNVAIIGNATDIEQAAGIIKQRGLAQGVRCHVVPYTRDDFARALKQGAISHLVDAGATIHPAGTPLARLAEDGALATTVTAPAKVWRGSVPVAAATACVGTLIHPERLDAPNQRDSKLSGRRRAL
jgi:3-isopropylmalate/(R)-2-methylmalate dehydratase large subunit